MHSFPTRQNLASRPKTPSLSQTEKENLHRVAKSKERSWQSSGKVVYIIGLCRIEGVRDPSL
jgi:hypothetical protein